MRLALSSLGSICHFARGASGRESDEESRRREKIRRKNTGNLQGADVRQIQERSLK
jgi:hypothetical protein